MLNQFTHLPSESPESRLAQVSVGETIATATPVNIVDFDVSDEDKRCFAYIVTLGKRHLFIGSTYAEAKAWALAHGYAPINCAHPLWQE